MLADGRSAGRRGFTSDCNHAKLRQAHANERETKGKVMGWCVKDDTLQSLAWL